MPGVLSAIKRTDQKLSELYLERVGERNALLAFYFHGLFRNETEIEQKQYHLEALATHQKGK